MNTIFLLLFFVSFIALIVGLVKPTAFSRFIKGEITRKKIAAVFGIATVASFVLFGITTDGSKNNNTVAPQPVVENTHATTESTNKNPAPVAEKTKTPPAPAKTISTTTQTPTPSKTEDKPALISSETVSQKNAVKKATSYLGYTAFSHDGLVAQLEYD